MSRSTRRKSVFVSLSFSADQHTDDFLDEFEKYLDAKGIDLERGITKGNNSSGTIQIWNDQVKEGIDKAACYVALLDNFNANVGWEAGYALATKPEKVILAKVGRTSKQMMEFSMKGHAIQSTWDRTHYVVKKEFLDYVDEVLAQPMRRRVRSAPKKLTTTKAKPYRGARIALVPQENNGELYRKLFANPPWQLMDVNLPWQQIKRWADGFKPTAKDTAVWVFLEPRGLQGNQDGVQNMNCALLAGYLYGQKKFSPTCVYLPHGGTRFLADQAECRKYYDTDDLQFKIQNKTHQDMPASEVCRRFAIENWWDSNSLTKEEKHVVFHPFRRCDATGELVRSVLHPWGDYAGTDAELEEYYDVVVNHGDVKRGTAIRWKDISNEELLDALVVGADQASGTKSSAARFLLAADAGVGKTISLRWLWRCLAERGQKNHSMDIVPLYIQANSLLRGAKNVGDIEENISLALGVGFKEERRRRGGCLQAQSVTHLLIDGLDQLSPSRDKESHKALREYLKSNRRISVILAGRRYAIREFDESFGYKSSEWHILRLKEFKDTEIKLFLGYSNEYLSIYQKLPMAVQRILCVPRLLALFTSLKISDALKVQSSSDIFAWATTQLIATDVTEGKLREIGKGLGTASRYKVQFVSKLLARLAYLQLSRFQNNTSGWIEALTPNFHELPIQDDVINDVHRTMKDIAPEYTRRQAKIDLERNLLSIGWAIEHERSPSGDVDCVLTAIEWSNKSFLEYFGALWLSRYASEDESRDFFQWVFYHGDRKTELFYHVNLFIAEMPETDGSNSTDNRIKESTYRNPLVWMRTIEQWYVPLSSRAEESSGLRSCEMIFRTWQCLHAYAKLQYVDWWDRSYQDLFEGKAIVSPASIVPPNVESEAKRILSAYTGELQNLLTSSSHGSEVDEFVSQGWNQVPCGEFTMGYPKKSQGFPRKTKAFWEANLAKVAGRDRNGLSVDPASDLLEFAQDLNKRYWFTGLLGLRDWHKDVGWLHGVFVELRNRCLADDYDRAIDVAYKAIEKNWRRKDENTHKDEPKQKIRSFVMREVPVLNRHYSIFEPGHGEQVAFYIASSRSTSETATPSSAELKAAKHPEDHPAIYISWYSAWAFCQWARWTDEASAFHWLRLPHEPEWEFAARHMPGPGGKIAPRKQRYWWGSEVYANEEGGDEEDISNQYAHAIQGGPGSTSSPYKRSNGIQVEGNGLGFRDILGNVWEWCANSYNEVTDRRESRYSRREPTGKRDSFGRPLDVDGRIWEGRSRAMRGGVWYFLHLLARLSHRYRLPQNDCDYKIGFRVVRETVLPPDCKT